MAYSSQDLPSNYTNFNQCILEDGSCAFVDDVLYIVFTMDNCGGWSALNGKDIIFGFIIPFNTGASTLGRLNNLPNANPTPNSGDQLYPTISRLTGFYPTGQLGYGTLVHYYTENPYSSYAMREIFYNNLKQNQSNTDPQSSTSNHDNNIVWANRESNEIHVVSKYDMVNIYNELGVAIPFETLEYSETIENRVYAVHHSGQLIIVHLSSKGTSIMKTVKLLWN